MSKHNVFRLASTIFNTPQLITAEGFDPVARYLTKRLTDADFSIYKGKPDKDEEDEDDDEDIEVIGNVAIIKISGSLSYKPVYTLCGAIGTSYLGLIEQTQEAIDKGVKTIVYEVDSPGGQAAHCFDSADTLREMLDNSGVKSVAYVDGCAASAAYALSCVFDEVIIHPSASAGNIGCIVCLYSDAKALEIDGYKRICITSTPGKSPYAEDGSFSETFIDNLQQDVNRLGNEFCEHVAKFTGIPVEEVKLTDAKCFDASVALSKGLVSSVMNHREFSNYIAENYS